MPNTRSEFAVARLKFLGVCELHNTLCWLCGKPIDYTAPPQAPMAFELDHARPRNTHPELVNDPHNFRASHSRCNRSRGDKTMPVTTRGTTTWVKADW